MNILIEHFESLKHAKIFTICLLSPWVRVRGESKKGDVTVGICHRPPDQEDEIYETFFKQLEEDHSP